MEALTYCVESKQYWVAAGWTKPGVTVDAFLGVLMCNFRAIKIKMLVEVVAQREGV